MINSRWFGVLGLAVAATFWAHAQNMVGQPTNLTPDLKYIENWGKISWDGTRISFTSNKGKVDGTGLDKDLYIANVDGSGRFKASPRPKNAEECGWLSPDGSKVVMHAFTAAGGGENGATEIYIVDLATGVSTQMTYNAAYDAYPAWSPDGKKIVFCSQRGVSSTQSYQLFVMDADRPEHTEANPTGNYPIQLTNPEGVSTSAKSQAVRAIWSPDSKKILFLMSNWVTQPKTELYIMDAVDSDGDKWGDNLVRLTDNVAIKSGGVTLADPMQFTTDGRVFFTMGDRAGKFNIYSLDPTGVNKDIWQQTAGPHQADFICLSGDLKMMARISLDDNTNYGIGVDNTDVGIYTLENDDTPGNLNGTLVSSVGAPAAGYIVSLYNGYNPTPIATTTTDANGYYSFTGLRPGGYYVEFTSDGSMPVPISTVNRGVIVGPGRTTVQNAFTSPKAAPRPRGVIPTIKGSNVSIRWTVNLESTLPAGWTYVGFNIYRSDSETGPWTKLNSEPISKVGPYEYIDTTATDLTKSFYTMTTVTTDGTNTLESMFADVGQAANNLLYNASYEIDGPGTGRPDGWVPAMFGTGNTSTLETATEDRIEGSKAMCHRISTTQPTVNWDLYAHTDLPYCVPTDSNSMYINGTYTRFLDTANNTMKANTNQAYSITEPNVAIPQWYSANMKSNQATSASPNTPWEWVYNTNSQNAYEFATYTRFSTYMLGTATSTAGLSRALFDESRYQVKRVGPTGAVWGRILDANGNGVAGVIVSDGTRTTESGPYGAWALRNVPTGPVTVTISYPGVPTITDSGLNIGGLRFPNDHVFNTVIPISVGGRVTFASGEPAAGATVRAVIGNISTTGSEDTFTAVTDANGEYTFDFGGNPPDGTKTAYVVATLGGYQSVYVSGKAFAKAGRTNINLTLGPAVPVLEVGRTSTPPTIDGVFSAAEWQGAAEATLPFKVPVTTAPDVATKAYLLWDADNLYAAFVCDEPDPAGLSFVATGNDYFGTGATVWADDHVELFLDPTVSAAIGYGREVWQIGANGNATPGYCDGTLRTGPLAQALRSVEDIGGLTVASSVDTAGKKWICEMMVPFGGLSAAPLSVDPPVEGTEWRGLLGRYRKADGQNSGSAVISTGTYSSAHLWNTLKFVNTVTPPVTKGDLNADGAVNATDARIAIAIAAGAEALGARLGQGDIDGNSRLDIVDASRILRKVNGLETTW